MKKNNLEEKFDENIIRILEIKNKDGVIFYKLEDDINGKVYEFPERGIKSSTIRQVLKSKAYWETFKEIFKKDASEEDKEKENQQFAKSVVHPKTGIRSEKYNLEFFRQNPHINHWINKVGDEAFWKIWIKLH